MALTINEMRALIEGLPGWGEIEILNYGVWKDFSIEGVRVIIKGDDRDDKKEVMP